MADTQVIPVNTKNGQPAFPPVAQTPTPQGPPVPPEVQAALHEPLAPVDNLVSAEANRAQTPTLDDTPPAPTGIQGLDAQSPHDPLPPEISDLVSSEAATGNGVPKRHKGILEHITDFLPLVGALGGAMEAAGDPMHPPVGAELLQHSLQGAAQRKLEREKMQNVDMPLAQAHSDYFRAAAPAKVAVAGINAGARTGAAQIANRFKMTPGGLYDTQTNSLVPETAAGITVTPEIAQDFPALTPFIGKPMKLSDLAAQQNAVSRNLTTVQGAQGPALVNKTQGTAKDLGLGSPAKAGAENAAVQVWRTGSDGKPQLQTISRAEQLRTGEPSAQVLFNETGPTQPMRNMGQMAATVEPHLNVLREEIKQLSPYVGPMMGRLVTQGLAGKLGSTGDPVLDRQLGNLIADMKLAASAVGRTHFAGRTGLPASQYFEQLFSAARSPEEMLGVLDSVPKYIEGYADASQFNPSQPLNPTSGGGGKNNPPPPQKATPVYKDGKQIGTATSDQRKRGTYTPLKQR